MPRLILKIKDYYLEWSTVVDAPVTFGMPLEQFKEYYKEEYGNYGLEKLSRMLPEIDEYGSTATLRSPDIESNLKEFVELNRAGPKEKELTLDEIYKAFCLREPILDNWLPK